MKSFVYLHRCLDFKRRDKYTIILNKLTMTKIECKYGMNEKLQKVFKTSHVTVRRALRYESKSELANKIRTYALKNGGVIMTPSNNIK